MTKVLIWWDLEFQSFWVASKREGVERKKNEGVPKCVKESIDSFPGVGILFLGGTNFLRSKLGPLGHHVPQKMGQDVSLVKRFQKENSIAEFTEYLNSRLNLQNI